MTDILPVVSLHLCNAFILLDIYSNKCYQTAFPYYCIKYLLTNFFEVSEKSVEISHTQN